MKKITTLIVFTAIFTSYSFAQVAQTSRQVNLTTFTKETPKITNELSAQTSNELKTHPEYGILPYNAPCKDCYELLQKRDESHRYFVKEGSNGREFYQETGYNALNYRDVSGRLLTIDHRLKPTAANGVFSAGKQEFPVAVNLIDKYVSIINAGKQLFFNRNLALYIKKADGSLTSLGTPSWTDYTAGDDGIMIHNFYPGIDLELRMGKGNVESFYHVNRPLNLEGESLVIHDDLLLPDGLRYDHTYSEKQVSGLYQGATFIKNTAGIDYYLIASPSAYDENGQAKDRTVSLSYSMEPKNGFDLYVPISWMNSSSRSYPIVIDPFVTATSTLPVASITGSGYNANCFTGGCKYLLNVVVPPATTVVGITTTFWFRAYGQCTLDSGAWDLTYGACHYPTSPKTYQSCAIGLPGLCQLSNLTCYPDFQKCLPAPQCAQDTLPITLTFYRCTTPGQGCVFSCINVDPNTPWTMVVTGYNMNAHTAGGSICQGASLPLTASSDSGVGNPLNYTYRWLPGNLTGQNVSVSPTTTTTYTVYISDCPGIDSVPALAKVTVLPNDNPGFTISPNPDCANAPITITGNAGISKYNWLSPGGTPAFRNNMQSYQVSYISTGTYSITLIDSSGECVFDSTLKVTVSNLTATAGPDTSVCSGSKVKLHSLPGGIGFTYSWSPTNGLDSANAQNPTATVTATTTYTVTVTNSNKCTATATVTITLRGSITIGITSTGPTTFCQGTCDTLIGTGGATYVWTNIGNTSSISVCSAGTYSVTGTDANGCSGTATKTIVVNPNPTVSITPGDTSICEGASVQLCATTSANAYKWNPNIGSSKCVTVQNPASYVVTITDANGCTGSSTPVKVVVASPPTVVITAGGPTEFCKGGSITLTAATADHYTWSNSATTTSITVDTGGAYYVTGINNGPSCPAKSNTINVIVDPLPNVIATAGGPITFCNGDSVILIASGANNGSYQWSPAGNTPSITVKTGGSYFAVGTDGHQCTGTSNTIVVTVEPNVIVSIGAIAPLCSTSPAVTLTGSPAGGTFIGPGVVGNMFDPSLTGNGTFTITYKYTANGVCTLVDSATTQVTVAPQATVSISMSPTIGCLNHTIYYGYGPQNVTLTANSNSVISTYQWYLNGAPVAGGTSKTLVTNQAGSYNIIVTVPGGCPSDSNATSAVVINVVDIRCGHNLEKVILCHVPDCRYEAEVTICIAPEAIPAHLRNHPCDCLGPCTMGHHKRRVADDLTLDSDEDMLLSAYPNPFTSLTTIEFERLNDAANVLVEVYSLTGEKVATLFNGYANVGESYKVQFDGTSFAQGIYMYRISSGDKVFNGKLVLIK